KDGLLLSGNCSPDALLGIIQFGHAMDRPTPARPRRERSRMSPYKLFGLDVTLEFSTTSFSPLLPSVMLSPERRAFGRWLLQCQTPGPTSGQARPRRRSCRASSTTCKAESGGSPLESPPTPPGARALLYQDSSKCYPSPRRRER